MPPSQPARIAALVEQLASIGEKRRGMAIEAEDWNAIVAVLQGMLEIERLQEEGAPAALQARFAPRLHDHLGQVSSAWLDAELQAALGGGGDSLAARRLLATAEKKIEGLNAEVARLTSQVERLQRSLDAAEVARIDTTRLVRDVDERFSGLSDLETAVSALGSEVQGLRGPIDEVLELRGVLTDATGAPIDVAGLVRRVDALADLSANFTGIDGQPVRLRDIQLQLRDLSDAVDLDAGGLDSRIAAVAAAQEERLNADITTRFGTLSTELDARLAATRGALEENLNGRMTTLGAEITAATNSAIAAAESRLNGGVDERVAGAIAAERAATADLVQRRVTEGLAGLDGRIDERLGARLGTLRGELEGVLMGRIDERMAATGARLDGQVNDLAQRIGRIEQDLPERIAEDVTARIGDLRAALQEETRAEIARASEAAAAGLTARLDEAVRAAQAALREQTSRLIDERLADLDARIATGVSRATADLEAEIGAEVTRQLTAADITGQVAAATAESQRGLLTRLERGLADQQARTSAAITAASDGLRADLTREIDSRLANERLRTTEMLRATETRLTTEISRFTPTRPGPVIRRPTGGNPG